MVHVNGVRASGSMALTEARTASARALSARGLSPAFVPAILAVLALATGSLASLGGCRAEQRDRSDPRAPHPEQAYESTPDQRSENSQPDELAPTSPPEGFDAGTSPSGSVLATSETVACEGSKLDWSPFLTGDAESTMVCNGAPDVAVFDAGYGASLADARAWATRAIIDTSLAKELSRAFAFRGPNTVNYGTRHFANSRLVSELLERHPYGAIAVFAHSSGAFVANELVAQLKAKGAGSRVKVYVLDGIYSDNLAKGVRSAVGVWARVGSATSRNAASMRSFPVNVPVTPSAPACTSSWCLHFGVITSRPSGSLATDYRAPSIFGQFLK